MYFCNSFYVLSFHFYLQNDFYNFFIFYFLVEKVLKIIISLEIKSKKKI